MLYTHHITNKLHSGRRLLTGDVFYMTKFSIGSFLVVRKIVILTPGCADMKYRAKEAKQRGAKFGWRVKRLKYGN